MVDSCCTTLQIELSAFDKTCGSIDARTLRDYELPTSLRIGTTDESTFEPESIDGYYVKSSGFDLTQLDMHQRKFSKPLQHHIYMVIIS